MTTARRAKKPSLASVARKAGVSSATVSLVLSGRAGDYRLSDATAGKVLAAAEQLGYRRAEQRRGQLRLHVMHLDDLLRMEVRGLGGSVLYPLLDALTSRGWLASVDPRLPTDPDDAGPSLFSAAAVLLPVNLGFDERVAAIARAAAARGVQPVILGRHLDGVPAIQVDGDQHGGGRLLAEHLIGLGHRRIAVIGGAAGDPHSDARQAGFAAVCAEHGIALPASHAWGEGGYQAAGAHRLVASRLAAGPRPTAIVCCNDRMALGALLALREVGLRVPEDVSLVGFDDQQEFSEVAPGLTTVRLDTGGLGARLADLLVPAAGLRDERISVPTRLVIRGSTAPPRKQP
jgi:LacI family transcriptional regulator